MPKETEVDTYKGFSIRYHTGNQRFNAYDADNKQILSADTQKQLERQIDAYLKTQFQPLEVIDINNNRFVKITSRDPMDPNRQVWISFKESDGKTARAKERLKDWNGNPRFYKTTPENLAIFKEIGDKLKMIKLAEDDIAELKKKFTEPVL